MMNSILLQKSFTVTRKSITRAFSSLPSTKVNFEDEWKSANDYKSIPGMTRLDLVRAFTPGGKLYKVGLTEMHKKLRAEYGDIYKFPGMLGRDDLITVFNPDDVEKIFRSEGKLPNRGGLEALHHYRKNVRPEIYSEFGSLASEQGEAWHKMRTLVNPVMMKPGTVKRYIPQVDEISMQFIEMILNMRDENNEVPANFSAYLNMWSLESITYISINQRLGILNPNNTDVKAKQLIQLVRRFFNLSFEFEIQPAIWKFYETKKFKELMTNLDGITDIIIHYVDKAIKELEDQPNEEREESILGKLVKINKKVAVVMCIDALFAGIDTTSAATVGILQCLAKNQDKQDKLREELRRCFPDPREVLTAENMKNMPYLRAVIKEGMRLYPPVSGTVRRINEDLVIAGHQVPKGTDILMVLMLAYGSDKHFGQAKEFVPERWLKNTEETCPVTKNSHPFAFLPFGFGARMCVGKRLAEMEIEVLISRLVRDYKIEWKYPDMKIKSVLVNIPDSELKFKITEL